MTLSLLSLSVCNFSRRPNIDVWQSLAELFNKLAGVDISSIETHAECPAEGSVLVALCLCTVYVCYNCISQLLFESRLGRIITLSLELVNF